MALLTATKQSRPRKPRASKLLTNPATLDIRPSDVRGRVLPRRLPASEDVRNYFGRAIDLAVIERAMRAQDYGCLTMFTDLARETLALDPHMTSCASKRFLAPRTLPWTYTPASGEGIDEALAKDIAITITGMLRRLRGLGRYITGLAWGLFDNRAVTEVHWASFADARGRIGPVAMEWIHPRRIALGAARELRVIDPFRERGFDSTNGFNPDADYPGKFLTWKPQQFAEYPEREGLAPRSAYWGFFKRFGWRHRMILTEIFAIPWRIVKVKDGAIGVNPETLTEAYESAQALAGEGVAKFGEGIDFDLKSPDRFEDGFFTQTSDGVNAEMSKLYLGNTGTTDNAETNRSNGIIAKGEQNIFLGFDADGISEVIQELCDVIVVVNWGADALSHAGEFRIDASSAFDVAGAIAVLEKKISLGVPVAVAELREIGRSREPKPGEPVVIANQPLAHVSAYADPTAPGEDKGPSVDITPADVAACVSVNEVRRSRGLEPLALPDGTPDPDGELTVGEFKAKREAKATPAPETPPSAPSAEPAPVPAPEDEPEPTPEEKGTAGQEERVAEELQKAMGQALTLVAELDRCGCSGLEVYAAARAVSKGDRTGLIRRGLAEDDVDRLLAWYGPGQIGGATGHDVAPAIERIDASLAEAQEREARILGAVDRLARDLERRAVAGAADVDALRATDRAVADALTALASEVGAARVSADKAVAAQSKLELALVELHEKMRLAEAKPAVPYAQRSAALLADIRESRALGFEPDVAELARKHEVEPPWPT